MLMRPNAGLALFYEILVAAIAEHSPHIIEARARYFFAMLLALPA